MYSGCCTDRSKPSALVAAVASSIHVRPRSALQIMELGMHPGEAFQSAKAFGGRAAGPTAGVGGTLAAACKAVPLCDASMGICTVEHCWLHAQALSAYFARALARFDIF